MARGTVTQAYLVEHAEVFYRMREEMIETEARLARDLRDATIRVASQHGLELVEQEEDELEAGWDEERLVGLRFLDPRLRLPDGDGIALHLLSSIKDLLVGDADDFAMLSMSPLSMFLDDLELAKKWWFEAECEEYFESAPGGWSTYTNNRVPHTFWGASLESSPSLDLKALASAWKQGEPEKGIGSIADVMLAYAGFAERWSERMGGRLQSHPQPKSA